MNEYPGKSIATRQTAPIDRLHRHLGLPFRDNDSQIAITLGTGALQVLRQGTGLRADFLISGCLVRKTLLQLTAKR